MKSLAVAVGILSREPRYFLQRRAAAEWVFPGLWEFPGGKLEGTESPLEALYRELEEELKWTPDCARPLPPLLHRYAEFEVMLLPFLCTGGPLLRTELACGWFLPREILAVPEATARLVSEVLPRL